MHGTPESVQLSSGTSRELEGEEEGKKKNDDHQRNSVDRGPEVQ